MTFASLRKVFSLFVVLIFVGTEIAASQTNGATLETDEINKVDADGKRQGFWRVVGPVKNKPDHDGGKLYEEGNYVDSKKTGMWKRFWPNGKLLSEIEYKQNRPLGNYRIYHKDGTIEEQGNWEYNTNTGDFKRYHDNGNLAQDFHFSENGLRNGEQKYYHDNGRLAVDVNIVNGKEQGTLKRYYENGDLKAEVEYNEGKADQSLSRWVGPIKDNQVTKAKPTKASPKVSTEETVNEAARFKHNGQNTLYNKNRQITQTGEFKNGQLFNGKLYKRNQNGILYKIEMYREGVYIGDAIIGPDDY